MAALGWVSLLGHTSGLAPDVVSGPMNPSRKRRYGYGYQYLLAVLTWMC